MPSRQALDRLRAAATQSNSPILTTDAAISLAAALLDEVENLLAAHTGAEEKWVTINTAMRHFRIGRYAAERLCTHRSVRHTKEGKGWTRYNLSDLSAAMQKYGAESA